MATRKRNIELSPQLRSSICELRRVGFTYKKIHEYHREICISTIKTTCQRETLRINNQTKSRIGAPWKLSDEQRDHLYDIAMHQNPNITNRDI